MAEQKLRDPFGQYQWLSPSRWTNGVNARRAVEAFQDMADGIRNGPDAYGRQFEAAKATLEVQESALNAIPGLHHVAIGSDTTGGATRLTFIAYLRPGATSVDEERIRRELPERLRGSISPGSMIPIQIERLAQEPIAFGFSGGDPVVGEPALRGVCSFVFSQDGANYFITNSHILTEPDTDPTDRRCWYFDTLLGRCVYGATLRSQAVNRMDAVVIRTNGIIVTPMAIGNAAEKIIDRGDLRVGTTDPFIYVANNQRLECFNPRYVGSQATVILSGNRQLRFAGFWKLSVASGSPAPGHSGAILCSHASGGLIIRGLVFGGVVEADEVWVFTSSDVWRELFN